VVRVVTGRREQGRLRVVAAEQRPVRAGAVVAGLVVDRDVVASALAAALAAAERGGRAERLVLALDGDDIRTFHLTTGFQRAVAAAAVTEGEMARAAREATVELGALARAAVADDGALRGIPTVHVREDLAGYVLDGRPLASLVGFQGRLVDVAADVTVVPLVVSGAAQAVAPRGRAATGIASGAHVLGRLLAASGVTDAAIVRLGPDVTSLTLLRGGRVAATRSFSLGRSELLGREREPDARVWSAAVLEALGDAETPERWLVAGVPDGLHGLPHALAAAAAERRGSPVDLAPLRASHASRVVADIPLGPDDLVAAGSAALGAMVVFG